MKELRRQVGRFVLLFAVVLAVLVPLWGFIAPPYARAVVAAARPAFRLVERSDVTVVDARDGEAWVFRQIGDGRIAPFTVFDRYTFFALAAVVALFAASPGLGWRRRAVRGLVGIVGLFCAHVLYVIASIELAYVAMGLSSAGPWLTRMLDVWQTAVRIFWEAAPIAIWLAGCAGPWKRDWKERRAREEEMLDCAEKECRIEAGMAQWNTGEGRAK